MTKHPLIIGAVAVTLALTACSGPTSTPFPVGTCIADYAGADSDRSTVVDCTEDHYLDVFGLETWPGMADAIAASDAGAVYDAITGSEPSEIGDAYWDWAYEAAIPLYLDAIGLGGVTIDGETVEDLAFSPGAMSGWDYSLTTREAFVAGDHTTLFAATWYSPEGDQIQVAFPEGVTVADTMSGALPADLQGCFTRDPDASTKYTNVACTESHNGQYLAYVNGRVALGAEFMATVDPDTTVFADYGPVDDYCTVLIDTIYPGLLDSASWGVWSDQYGDGLGWAEYDGTILPDENYPIYCAILGTSGTTFTGDVISGDVNVSMTIG